MTRAAFLDRDGVINIDHAYVHDREHFEWIPGVLEAARILYDAGFLLVVVTNQSGIGRGYYSTEDFQKLTDWMKSEFARAGAPLAAGRYCPHLPEKALPPWRIDCSCRKPKPGMILAAAEALQIDLSRSIMFGDKPGDCTAGRLAGLPERVLLGTDGKSLPEPSADATHAARDLLSAVRSGWMADFMGKAQ